MENLIKQEKMLLGLVITFILFFGTVLYVGVNQIYNKEKKYSHGIANAQLSSGKTLIEAYFSDIKAHLHFIRGSSRLGNYIDSDFRSVEYENATRRMLENYMTNFKDIFQIYIVDDAYRIMLDLNRDKTRTVSFPNHLRMALKGDTDQLYLHFMEALPAGDVKGSALIVAAVPFYDKREQVKGTLIVEIDLTNLYKLLGNQIFIQTVAHNIVKSADDGTMVVESPGFHFKGAEGVIRISDTETLHYAQLKIPGAQEIIVAKYHQHELLTLAWKRLIIAALILFFLFFSLVLGIGYSAHVKIREKVLAQKAMIYSLIRLTDRRDHETGEHLERTQNYCRIIAKYLRKNRRYRKIITNQFIEEIYDASPLHDIGKVAIRDAILLKEGKLSDEEFDEMKTHVKIGSQIFDDIIHKFKIHHPLILMCRNICKYHHEKYNGKGYLNGLQGNEIPLEARIFALADVYDALRSQRPYKQAMSHEKTLEAILMEKGKHFDPAVVDAFLAGEKEIKDDCRYRYRCT